ncbi:hypothetical protein J5N97_000527 [Dioscorea zingiberensis]|uniref:Myb-like domain-containing protein n=1 Tax=Dioscorea zingiberensis TaxID=325984 RepID=A0A9D5H1L3_9LILI|nr:hypothetical protein J5N97_000527 [Dioscorea zingiberensis]
MEEAKSSINMIQESGENCRKDESDMSPEEEDLIRRLHRLLGDRWGLIAGRLPNRKAEEVENYWKMKQMESFEEHKIYKPICMVDQLMRHRVLDIYVQCLDVKHDVTLPEALLSDSEDVELERRQASSDIVELDAMEGIMGDDDDRPDRPREREVQPARDNLDLDERLGEAVMDIVNQDNTSDDSSDSGKDDEEIVADVPFINHNSDIDNEREEARDKIRRFVQLRRGIS